MFQLIFWGMYLVHSPVQGIQMFGQGQYSQAVDMFTEAICCDPKDHRWAELWTLTPTATLWPLSSPDSITWFPLSPSHSVCLTLSLLSLRFYGNRSYCYWFLDQYYSALTDALRSIQLAPDWPKGYFRKGCALMGLKVSSCCTTDWRLIYAPFTHENRSVKRH